MESPDGAGAPAPVQGAAAPAAPSISIADHDEEAVPPTAPQEAAPATPPPEGAPGGPPPAPTEPPKEPAKGVGDEAESGIAWLWTGKFKVLKVIGVAAIVLIAVLGAYVFFLQSQTGVTSVEVGNAVETDSGLQVYVSTASAGAEDYSGSGKIEIYYTSGGGRDLTYTGSIDIDADGTAIVPYDEFVDGPGNYDIVVEADGEKGSTIYNCLRVADDVNFWIDPFSSGDEQFLGNGPVYYTNASAFRIHFLCLFRETLGMLSGSTLEVRYQSENGPLRTDVIDVSGLTSVDTHLDYYDGPGNYTMEVTLTNNIKSDSDHYELTQEFSDAHWFNGLPDVDAGPDQQEDQDFPGQTVTFNFYGDAEDEGLLDDDQYEWIPSDDPDNSEGEDRSGQSYSREYDTEGGYWVRLKVTDEHNEVGFDEVIVTVGNP